MVGVYDSIESFYASDDPYRFEYEGFYSSPTMDSGFGSSSSSFYTGLDDELSPYLGDPYLLQNLDAALSTSPR